MNDDSSLLLIDQLCDSFEMSTGETDEHAGIYDAADFLEKVKGSEQNSMLTEAFFKSLTAELMVIELQSPPFPVETALREKYPQFDDEITLAIKLAQQNPLGTSAENAAERPVVSTDELRLPIEERLDRLFEKHSTTENVNETSSHLHIQESRKLGRYRLTERLGAGGFGIVYRAHDPLMRRDVAIKLPRTSLMNEPSDRTRFEREMNALSRLNHPNIVTTYHAEQVDGYFCLISEYLDGGNLEDWLLKRSSPLSADVAVSIVLQLCDSLNHAHDLGVVHCDIKPSNIMIGNRSDKNPLVKLTDFGLARVLKDGAAVTSAGLTVGTLQYMSPEQLTRKSNVEVTTDIYSLGIVLYRLLAGEHPFGSENEIELISQIVERQPPALQSNQFKVSPDLAAIVSKCLMKRPIDRYQSATEFKNDLQSFLMAKPVTAKPLGIAGRVSHWLKSKHRIREAGIYSLSLHVVLTAWCLLFLPIYHVTGLLEQIGIDRMFNYLLTVIMLLATVVFPNIWAASQAINLRSRGVWVGLFVATVGTGVMLLQLFNVFCLDFGGIYENETTRVVVFALLSFLFGLQAILYGVALYASHSQKRI